MPASWLLDRRLWPLWVEGRAQGKSQGGVSVDGGVPSSPWAWWLSKGMGPNKPGGLRSWARPKVLRLEAQAQLGPQDGSSVPSGVQ